MGESFASPNLNSLDAFGFETRRVDKPWGHELIWALTDDYCGKILFVRAGESLSLQFHREKDESWYVIDGRAELELGGPGQTMLNTEIVGAGAAFRFAPGHRPPRDARSRTRASSRSRRRSSTTSSGSRTTTGAKARLEP